MPRSQEHEDEGESEGVEVAGEECKTGASGADDIDSLMAAACISMRLRSPIFIDQLSPLAWLGTQ